MDTETLKGKGKDTKAEQISEKVNNLDNKLLSKDEEIRQLKAKLAEAQTVNVMKKGDIRAEVNRLGDVKLICIGVDDFGKRIWKKANLLTDADIERRNMYLNKIKQENAKKN